MLVLCLLDLLDVLLTHSLSMQHALSSLLPADKIVNSIAVNVSNLRSAAPLHDRDSRDERSDPCDENKR